MHTFEIGKVYSAQGGGSHVWHFRVVKRTAKFITIEDMLTGEQKRVGVRTDWDGLSEITYPLGTYSMCPVMVADRTA